MAIKNQRKQETNQNQSEKFCIYLGPTISGVIQKGTIYTGDKAQAESILCEAIKRYPLIKQLIVDEQGLCEARVRLSQKDSFLNAVYKKLSKQIEGGN